MKSVLERQCKPILSNSFFLFGARGTGKTTLLKQLLSDRAVMWIDLLDPAVEDRYATSPGDLLLELKHFDTQQKNWIIIDEIQKVPKLLNLVHKAIEETNCLFALTGSSARKLKRGSANMLAGRAFVNTLHPFTHQELGDKFNLDQALNWGTLPKILELTADIEKKAYLRSYALTYLKEEVWAEHLVRKLENFRAFLPVAAQSNGELVNYHNIARDVAVDSNTVKSYFQILEDTLLGFFLEPYHRSVRKRQSNSPKFYFFDPGIIRALAKTLGQEIVPNTYAYGKAFEHFVILEMFRFNEYNSLDFSLSYLRTRSQVEIDVIIERPGTSTLLVEIKSSERVDDRDTKALEALRTEIPNSECYCISRDQTPKRIGAVSCLPWKLGLAEMGFCSDT